MATLLVTISAFCLFQVALSHAGHSHSHVCKPDCTRDAGGNLDYCKFNVYFDPYPSTTGYYKIKECGDVINPTIGMYRDVVTEFMQSDVTNWFHPLGFAYDPDGLHKTIDGLDQRELDPTVSKTNTNPCRFNNTCMAPMYFLDGKYLGGSYSNIGPIADADRLFTTDLFDADFGLDGIDRYEWVFTIPRLQWIIKGKYSVKLKWTDKEYTKDLFYFCHIHDNMSGRIKLVNDEGEVIQVEDDPPLGYSYETLSDFDKTCGMNQMESYTGECPGQQFICTKDDEKSESDEDSSRRLSPEAERILMDNPASTYATCLGVIDCHMHHDMKIQAHPTNPAATFMYQMIPHHINAVNMAKALLKLNYLQCNYTSEYTPERISRRLRDSPRSMVNRGTLKTSITIVIW